LEGVVTDLILQDLGHHTRDKLARILSNERREMLGDDAHLKKLTMNGVDAIILKPFKLKEIQKNVQRLLNV
jgi:type IV secretory pathway VirD2 relaxase